MTKKFKISLSSSILCSKRAHFLPIFHLANFSQKNPKKGWNLHLFSVALWSKSLSLDWPQWPRWLVLCVTCDSRNLLYKRCVYLLAWMCLNVYSLYWSYYVLSTVSIVFSLYVCWANLYSVPDFPVFGNFAVFDFAVLIGHSVCRSQLPTGGYGTGRNREM